MSLGAWVGIGVAPLEAQEHPAAEISNGEVQAMLYLPDPYDGFYRATRFEWAGNFGGLRYQDHEYFSPWSEPHDPTHHAAASGPVQEFVIDGVDYAGDDQATPRRIRLRATFGSRDPMQEHVRATSW